MKPESCLASLPYDVLAEIQSGKRSPVLDILWGVYLHKAKETQRGQPLLSQLELMPVGAGQEDSSSHPGTGSVQGKGPSCSAPPGWELEAQNREECKISPLKESCPPVSGKVGHCLPCPHVVPCPVISASSYHRPCVATLCRQCMPSLLFLKYSRGGIFALHESQDDGALRPWGPGVLLSPLVCVIKVVGISCASPGCQALP